MIYYGFFNNIKGEGISIDIVTNNDETDETELMLASNPITITSTSDGLFSPIKADAATIRILTDLIYSDMYSNKVDLTSVEIKNLRTGATLFRGYLTPNIYSLDYVGLDNLELEAVSALSTLKNIKFSKTKDIVSWYDLICEALSKVGYDSFYFPNSYLAKVNDEKYLLKSIYQFSDNFIDNDDERTPWTYYTILEEFCKYFCLSLVVFHSEIYFVDYANTKDYAKFNINNGSAVSYSMNHNYTITKDSYKETGAKISYDETYNKIAVKDNLYEMDNLLTDPMEDLVNQNVDTNKYYEQTINIDGKNYTYLNAFFKSDEWNNNLIEPEITPDNINTISNSSFWQKVDSYETETEPSSLNWKTYLTAYSSGGWYAYESLLTSPKKEKDLICNGGYFVINMNYKLSNNIYANDCFKTSDQKYSIDKYSLDIEDTLFPCKLYVGNYFFDGENWVNKSVFERKQTKGYYKDVAVGTFSPTPTWYKYKDTEGDWRFTSSKAEWDAATTEKASGRSDNTNKVYYYEEGSTKVFIDEDFYNECRLKDRFYLVHKNKKDDKIFDETKALTNSVSWRMNIVDSEDGVAIKLPKFLLNGKLIFELYTPNVLGDYGQYRTDTQVEKANAVHISQLEMVYKVSGTSVDIFDGAYLEDDVVYTNIINENYVNEFDNLELKVNTLVENRITSLSSVLYKPSIDKYYTFLDKVYDRIYSNYRLLEESIIERYYNHYKAPKLILEATLENKLHPLSLVTEPNLNKVFEVDSFELDVEDDSINVKLIEK